uniref:PRiA4b ORF-3-like protein n=1 Tax=Candidatus Kentrum eta TaxID=2126337 RepID=A0A450U5I8_9GAMM|nr:MAG: pRiA4b ORF-3-like protein [Candidatus Kentron sp. H]VFJ88317.1 MAG: pRiA4b ORF-3-like protein [Candidatus Kentron sp. H]VFJ95545.1 MAG: pRiA4b ORF-3-like protein [Candidatus Kentron sp. H]
MIKPLRETYQLKIGLKGSKPPIWRRILVVSTVRLSELHSIIQIVMGWKNRHLHQFVLGGERYGGAPDPDFGLEGMLDGSQYRLDQLLSQEKVSMIYEYDFGDGWEHKITLEKTLPFDPKATLPVCIKAKGACPPEDIGGMGGYYEFLEALNDPAHPEHEDYKEWVGVDFDPDAHDRDAVNRRLAGSGKVYF